MFSSRASVLGLAFALVSCGGPPRETRAPAASSASVASEHPPPPRAETSAFPPTDRAWTPKEYEQAASALRALVSDGARPLPNLSGDGAPLLARIVDRQVVDRSRDRSLSFDDRMAAVMDVEPPVGEMMKLYAAALTSGQPLGREVLMLSGFMVHLGARMSELCDELLLKVDPADPKFASRMAGYDQVVRGMDEMVAGTMVTAGALVAVSTPFWQDAGGDLALLVQHIGRASQEKALSRLAAIEKKATTPELRAALAAARQAMLALPEPDFTVASDEVKDASGNRLCTLAKARSKGAADCKLRAPLERPARVAVDAGAPYRAVVEVLSSVAHGDAPSTIFELRLSRGDDPTRLRLFQPAHGAKKAAGDGLGFTAFVARDGVVLKAKGKNVAPGCERPGEGTTVPNRERQRDIAKLAACAAAVKRWAPEARGVAVAANPDVPFSDVLAVADALRGPSLELFPSVAFAAPR
jgi:hypothetical protein